jgi:hypothetical protein
MKQRSFVWAVIFLALSFLTVNAQSRYGTTNAPFGWVEHKDAGEGFSVYFPVRPEEKVDKFTVTKGSPALTRHFYTAAEREGQKGRFMVGSVTLPVAAPVNGTATISREAFEKLMAKLKESFEVSLQLGGESGCYLGSPQSVFSGAHRGREYKIEGQGCPQAVVRMFSTARRFYVVAAVGTNDTAFLKTFQLLNAGERLIVE